MKTHLLSLAIFMAALSQLAAAQNSIRPIGAAPLDRPPAEAFVPANASGGDALGSEVRIRIHGDTAVVTGWFVTGRTREPYSAVWVLRGSTWRLVPEQASRIAKNSGINY